MSKDLSAPLKDNSSFIIKVTPKENAYRLFYRAKSHLELVEDVGFNNSQFLKRACEIVIKECREKMRKEVEKDGGV